MTVSGTAALFGAMVVLALIPSLSVLVVSTRSATSGFVHGAFTTAGIVTGDIVFILIALVGLSVLAETLGSMFVLVKYLGGAYLIWLGVRLWQSSAGAAAAEEAGDYSLLSSFLTGLLITLGDQKAIFFYLGLFPAFLDLSSVSFVDTGLIIVITVVAVGGVKLGYAYMADSVSGLVSAGPGRTVQMAAGGVMIAIGLFLMIRA